MAFDQATRNRLQKFVGDARKLLSEEFTQQLQNTYGLDPVTGRIAALSALPALSPSEQQTATLLRDTLDHYLAANHKVDPHKDKKLVIAALDRIVREQAFTVLNRLAALRMAEARGFIMGAISPDPDDQKKPPKGFQLYKSIAGSSLGESGQAYQHYLFSVFDELSLDLAVLFDRYSSQGRLFPRETVLLELLGLINHAELEMLWAEDETVGWIYQYWNVRSEIDLARGESRAPRNSREMAVRNQFFTPRYVVEFLVDNTVGKTWYEMQQGQTSITDKCDYLVIDEKAVFLSQGEKLTQEQAASDVHYIPYREPKDPRCLRTIDPACGSGHFLLYVFDLLIAIYEEAWQKEPECGVPVREKFEPLKKTYSSFDDFRKNIPALIIAHNLYGIDIDPRAIQIAGLAVWLRGQRYWQESGVKPIERPTITRSNLICAEPLIIDLEQLSAYRSTLPIGQSNLLVELLNIIADKMALAGEMGILLKLEKDIRRALEGVEQEFKRYQESEIQDDLFGRQHVDQQLDLSFSVQGLNSAFFAGAEKQLINALKEFVISSNQSKAFKKKLFADDIAHSLAFIDLMKLRFDAIVMNPPFGKPSVDSEYYMERNYPDNPSEVYQAFVDRGHDLLVPAGFLGALTSRTGFFLGSFESWRTRVLLKNFRPLLFVDFGGGVLDAMVETAAYVVRSNTVIENDMEFQKLAFDLKNITSSKSCEFTLAKYVSNRVTKLKKFQALDELDYLKARGLVKEKPSGKWVLLGAKKLSKIIAMEFNEIQFPKMRSIRLVNESSKGVVLFNNMVLPNEYSNEVDPSKFKVIPGAPFTYWINDEFKSCFRKYGKFQSEGRISVAGMQTGNDFRFARLWWEVRQSAMPAEDTFVREFNGPYCVLKSRWLSFTKGGASSPYYSDIQLVCNWFKDGEEVRAFSGSLIRNSNFYYRKGYTWPLRALRYTPAVLPSGTIFNVRSMSGFVGNDVSTFVVLGNSKIYDDLYKVRLGKAHTPEFIPGVANDLPIPDKVFSSNFNTIFESAYIDASLPYRCLETSRLYERSWFDFIEGKSISNAAKNYMELIERVNSQIECRQEMVDKESLAVFEIKNESLPTGSNVDWKTINGFPIQVRDIKTVKEFVARDLLSNLFGRLFGRFWLIPERREGRDPFDPLPVPEIDHDLANLPLKDGELKALLIQGVAPVGEYFNHSIDDILSDVSVALYPDSAGLLEDVLAELNVESLNKYFAKPSAFFDYHLSQYSGFSRIAPVYLPLSSSAGNFTVWLFYQKLSRASLFTVLNDVIEPALKAIDEQGLQVKGSSSTDEAKLSSLLDEIRDFRDSIQEILSAGFNCDIDDGVVIAAAPLRKLFKHSGWREELEQKWAGLEVGDYEWTKLALNYWPERVTKKCLEDRSIAIAHGIETDLWEEVEVPATRGNGTRWVWQAKDLSPAELKIWIENRIAQ